MAQKEAAVKVDALEAILTQDKTVEKDIPIKRLNTDFRIRSVGFDESESIQEEIKGMNGSADETQFGPALIARGCINPDFGNAKVLEKFGVATAVQAVKAALNAGEIIYVMQEIMDLSGYDNIPGIKK